VELPVDKYDKILTVEDIRRLSYSPSSTSSSSSSEDEEVDDHIIEHIKSQPIIDIPSELKDDDEIVNEFHSLWHKIPQETWLVYEGVSFTFNDGVSLLPGKTPTLEVNVITLHSVNIK
jgi:hypothetical protein